MDTIEPLRNRVAELELEREKEAAERRVAELEAVLYAIATSNGEGICKWCGNESDNHRARCVVGNALASKAPTTPATAGLLEAVGNHLVPWMRRLVGFYRTAEPDDLVIYRDGGELLTLGGARRVLCAYDASK